MPRRACCGFTRAATLAPRFTQPWLPRVRPSDEPQGIQRTALTPEGKKVERNGKTLRMSLGAIAGGAIKIDDDTDVTMGLVIGEGVETCLTARQRYDLAPVWSAVTSGGVASFPVLPGLEGLTLLRENDANGASARAIETCAGRWHDAGRHVRICDPEPEFCDLNDELREARK
jgi:putative DNA primase/helicase